MQCPICSNSEDNRQFSAKEMMIGMRNEFTYTACRKCGCVWLKDIPSNMADFYPKNYYSYHRKPWGFIEKFQKKHIALSRLNMGIPWLGKLFIPFYPRYLRWLNSNCRIDLNSRILDVGSGSGRLLLEMNEFGFKNLTGVDPFVENDISYENGVNIYRKSIDEVEGEYDFIMFHHSFEHMENPQEVLRKLKTLVAPGGRILIRIPVADSYSYENYGPNWVELDPPRHFFLHTKKSMKIMASAESMKIDHIMYDSSNFEIMESEKWKKNIPSSSKKMIFNKKERAQMNKFVDDLNEKGKGSRACFYISPKL